MLSFNIEKKIKTKALEYLKRGRTNWDVRHTLTAVKWMKELVRNEGGDEKILIPAIYFHDTGYEKLRPGYTEKECQEAKPNHATRGAEIANEFLSELNEFKPDEIQKIRDLILHHDEHDNIDSPERQLIFEADGLGQIDWYNCKPSYDKENTLIFMKNYFTKERILNFRTKTGKKYLKGLLKETKKYLKEWKDD